MARLPSLRRWLVPAAVLLAAVRCGGGLELPNDRLPAHITLVSGNAQQGVAGQPLTDSLIVGVTDTKGNPVQYARVVFQLIAVGSGAGDLIPDTAVTDANGRARSRWVLGQLAGQQRVDATVLPPVSSGALRLGLTATALAGAPDTVAAILGAGQTAAVGSTLADSLIVLVTDQFGNPTSGSDVQWSVPGGEGSVSATTVTTGTDGRAAVSRSLGPSAGTQTATATVAGVKGSPVTFTSVATSGGATRLVKVLGDNRVAPAGFTDSIVVRLEDVNGNGVPNRSITWSPAQGGSVLPASSQTDANGYAFTFWTLGPAAGAQSVTATATPSGFQVTFNATATASQPTTIARASGNPASYNGTVGQAVAPAPSVRVTDHNSNPVQGVNVDFVVTGGAGQVSNGSVTGAVVTILTDANGIATLATWTLGTVPGANSLEARALNSANSPLSGSPVGWSATAQAGSAARLAITTQPSATAQSSVPLARQPAVQLQDSFGNAVSQSGITVTAAVVGGGAAVHGTATALTDAAGLATFSTLSLGGPVASYTLRFSASGLAADSSAAVVLSAGPAATLIVAVQPSSTAQSGVTFAVQPAVQLQDSDGNVVDSSGVTITAAIASGGGSLSGTATAVTGVTGLASFTGLSISGTAGPRTLSFTAPGLTAATSGTITVSAGPASLLVKTAGDNQSASAGSPLLVDPQVRISDASNNPVAGVSVTFAVATGGGSGGAVVATDLNGLASVTWTLGPSAGPNTLTATAALTGGTTTVTFTATGTAGTAGRLAIATQPSTTAASGAVLAQQPAIQLQDLNNNDDTTSNVPVTAHSSATLGGTVTVLTVNGLATFTNLSLTGLVANNPFTLTFTSTNLASVTSGPIALTAGPAARLAVQTQPPASDSSGVTFTTQPAVQVQDIAGNPVSSTRTVTAGLQTGTGTLVGTTTAGTGGGSTATFGSLGLSGLVGSYALSFTSGVLIPDTSATITLTAGRASSIASRSVTSQSAQVSTAVGAPPSVRVLDGAGNPVSGVTVAFAVTAGGGSLTGASQVTDAAGIATVTSWTIGAVVGTNTVTASVAGLSGSPVSFSATGTAGPATTIAINAGNSQSATVHTSVAIAPSAKVTDAGGNAVAGVSVTFAVASGGGTVNPTTAILTNSSGLATVTSWTLGTAAGANTLTATSGTLTNSPLTFTATGTATAAKTLAKNAGDGQSAPAGQALATAPQVLVTDSFGNPRSGTSVTFAVASGGGSVNPTSAILTNSNGLATVTSWTLGTLAGTNTLTATSAGLSGSPATFTATGTTSTATKLALTTAPSSTAQSGIAFAIQPVVQLQDVNSNAVSQAGVTVTATLLTGTGAVGSATAVTNASGTATFTALSIAGTTGSYSLSFDSPPLTGVTSGTITLSAGTATKLGITTAPSSSGQSGIALSSQPRVQIEDSVGNNVSTSGVLVTASIASGPSGATLTNPTASTSSSGRATFSGFAISGPVGTYTIQFDAPGLTGTVSGNVTISAGTASTLTITTQPAASDSSGVAFATQPVLQLRDGAGNTVSTAGIAITASIASSPGGGSLTNAVATTIAGGSATFNGLTITGPVGSYTLSFTGTGLSPVTSSTITLGSGRGSKLALTTQPSASAQNGQVFAQQPVVQLQDASNNPVLQAGVSVSVTIASGGGSLGGTTPVSTNASGQAVFTNLSITGLAGARTLTFATSGYSSVTSSSISITAGTPTTIALSAGSGQTATAGSAVAIAPAVLVTDASGNPVGGVTVTFAAATGGGSVTGGSATTNASGIATVGSWTLGSIAGTNTLTATATGSGISGNPVTFTATGTVGAAAIISVSAGNNQSATVGMAVATNPAVLVTDSHNNPVNGVSVTFAVATGAGSVTGGSATTNASGIATVGSWTLGNIAGTNTLTAAATGSGISGNPVTFTATGTVGAAAIISVSAGNNQSATAGTAVATAPAVLVTDSHNNPVNGVSVTFAVATGAGSVTGGSATTNASGIATVGSWTLGTVAGTNTLTATSGTLSGSPVTFTATGTVGPADHLTFSVQPPSTAMVGAVMSPAIEVSIEDAHGNLVSGATDAVTVAIGNDGAGGGSVLGGTIQVNAVAGVASFSDLTIDQAGSGFTLTVASGSLTGDTSVSFDITP